MISPKKIKQFFIFSTTTFIVLVNIMAYHHAYKFTHFKEKSTEKTTSRVKPENLSFFGKVNTLLFGVQNFKPKITNYPQNTFETIILNSNVKLEGWLIQPKNISPDSTKGTVILFHGYTGNKSSLIEYGNEFRAKGYAVFLIDFMGSGNSEGYQTTVGYKESENVKSTFDYIKKQNLHQEIILFGHSMGAVAIMKAVAEYKLQPNKIIIQCPFGSMKTTVKNRFKAMGVPSFPFAELLVFYGGLQNNFNAFEHNPTKYAKYIEIPTLLVHGQNDQRVTANEIHQIFNNLAGQKELLVLKESGHDGYLENNYHEWTKTINTFIETK